MPRTKRWVLQVGTVRWARAMGVIGGHSAPNQVMGATGELKALSLGPCNPSSHRHALALPPRNRARAHMSMHPHAQQALMDKEMPVPAPAPSHLCSSAQLARRTCAAAPSLPVAPGLAGLAINPALLVPRGAASKPPLPPPALPNAAPSTPGNPKSRLASPRPAPPRARPLPMAPLPASLAR